MAGAANLASVLGVVKASDTQTVARALVDEIVDLFSPQSAALYLPQGREFRVAASHGLSAVERHLMVPADHRLFAEIIATCSGVLIAPVDMAQGLVAGIAGTWTDRLMVVPVAAGCTCHGILVVGSSRGSERDLEHLIALAGEAAPLLALSTAVGVLREELAPTTPGART